MTINHYGMMCSPIWDPNIKAVRCAKGGDERNKTNLNDKSTSPELTPVVNVVSYTKKRKGKKRDEPNNQSKSGA